MIFFLLLKYGKHFFFFGENYIKKSKSPFDQTSVQTNLNRTKYLKLSFDELFEFSMKSLQEQKSKKKYIYIY